MKKSAKLIAVSLVLALLLPLFSASAGAASTDHMTQEEILDAIISGSDYLVGDGVPLGIESGVMPAWTGGGNNHTHQYITSYAFRVLSNDKSSSYQWYINLGAIPGILEGSDLPDKDETEGAYERHFYDPATGLNYSGNTNNAKNWFLNHYQNAVSSFNAGNYTKAWEELGRAIHYLEDLNTPHHVANLIAVLSNHSEFERTINNHRTRYSATTAGTKYNTTISALPNICATNAKNYVDKATTRLVDPSLVEPWLQAGDYTVPFAMQYVAVVLHRFNQDVTV